MRWNERTLLPLVAAAALYLVEAGCSFAPGFERYQACDEQGGCPTGCTCMAEQFCASNTPGVMPWICPGEWVPPEGCEDSADCPTGCDCLERACVPDLVLLPDGGEGYCSAGTELTCVETVTDVTDYQGLRAALIRARSSPGPHRIRIDLPPGTHLVIDDELPILNSLTWLDGGGVILDGGGVNPGLVVDGFGVVISNLGLYGFLFHGIKVEPGSREVHLFHLRVANTLSQGASGGHGIWVQGSDAEPVQGVFIGRGRELDCLDPVLVYPGGPNEEFDANVIVGNDGAGILVQDARNVNIYGSWVGFDTENDLLTGNSPWLANQGPGIHLQNVDRAKVGAQSADAEEAYEASFSPLPAFVGVGRNHGGGVLIEDSGRIELPGLIVGNSPTMNPYDENEQFGLRIESNYDFVHFGPSPFADMRRSQDFCEVYSVGEPMIQIVDNRAPVWIRGVQIWSTDWWGATDFADYGVEIEQARAMVKLHHLTFVHDFHLAAIKVRQMQNGGRVELINNLFFQMFEEGGGGPQCPAGQVPVVDFATPAAGFDDPDGLRLVSNMKYCFTNWCVGDCLPFGPLSAGNFHQAVNDFDCSFQLSVPTQTSCPNVDSGATIEVAPGQTMQTVMGLDGYHNGCAPDIGFVECYEDECRNLSCP